MPKKRSNLEIVRRGLECCIQQANVDIYCKDLNCPYYGPIDSVRLVCWTKLNKDCLKLIDEQKKQIEELEERVAIMSEDQYKCSEIRFP